VDDDVAVAGGGELVTGNEWADFGFWILDFEWWIEDDVECWVLNVGFWI